MYVDRNTLPCIQDVFSLREVAAFSVQRHTNYNADSKYQPVSV